MVAEATQQTESKAKEYKVFLGTGYLTEGLESFKCPAEFLTQALEYGYDPNNLHGMEFLQTPRGNIIRLSTRDNSQNITLREIAEHDFAIAGSTKPNEEKVLDLKCSGLVVARYSIFYGGPSGYSDRSPEDGGYSLDLPKVVPAAVALMTNDDFLEAIVSREEARVRDAIAKLNVGHENAPVLITPFLSEALRIRKGK